MYVVIPAEVYEVDEYLEVSGVAGVHAVQGVGTRLHAGLAGRRFTLRLEHFQSFCCRT